MKLLFVYGTLKRGFWLNHFLMKSKYIKDMELKGYTLYSMDYKTANCPYMVATGDYRDTVKGELWEVDNKTFNYISSMEIKAGYSLYKTAEEKISFYAMEHICKYTTLIGSEFKKSMQNVGGTQC